MSPALKKAVEDTLSEKLKKSVNILSVKPAQGGCINECATFQTPNGTFFIKWNNRNHFPEMFEKEATDLNLLHSKTNIGIPKVISLGNSGNVDFIILEVIISASRKKNFWENFGISLANLHRNSAEKFGLEHDNYIGSLVQYNEFQSDWVEFFISQRLEKQIKLAYDNDRVSQIITTKFHKLFPKLNEIFPPEKPSLLHGDLWNGNFMTGSDGYAWLIDPAVYYGHREAELAFTKLFGGFDEEFYESYQNNFPLEPGFSKRVDVYNLYPLMVHVNLFGGGYISSVESILNQYV